ASIGQWGLGRTARNAAAGSCRSPWRPEGRRYGGATSHRTIRARRSGGGVDRGAASWKGGAVPELDTFSRVAQQAVAAASQRLREAAAAEKRIQYKSAIDLVTDTDREVEGLIVDQLRRAFPDHLIVGEEGSAGRAVARPRPGQYAWYIDPLDGTTNFAHGHPHFAVSVGLARDDE